MAIVIVKDLTKGYCVLYICVELLTVRSLIEMPLALCQGKLLRQRVFRVFGGVRTLNVG